MAYPQPGQFPAYPQYPGQAGTPAKPPVPKTVQNAFYLMIAGAVLEVLSTIFSLGSSSKVRDTIRTQHPEYTDTQVTNAVHVATVFAVIIVLIGVGLWIWMAFANRAGKNWARITGTVFFGLNCVALLVTLGSSSSGSTMSTKSSGVAVALSVVIWVIGLATVILLWNKQSGPYFKPPQFGAGGPGGAAYPYAYGAPGQQPMPPAGSQPPYGAPQQTQPPTDPWSNPNPPQQ